MGRRSRRADAPGAAPPASSFAPARRLLRSPWLPAIVGLLCFLPSLGNDFTYDDVDMVRENARIRSLANFREIWLSDWWYAAPSDEGVVDPNRDRLYRPLTLFSFALNYAVHGLSPPGFHAVNVLLHALASGMVLVFARRLLRDDLAAAVAALLFAVHPVHAEAVANIVGRAEILAAVFLLSGLLLLLPVPPGAATAGPLARPRLAAAAGLFLLALLSKETAICYPALALIALHASGLRRPLTWWLPRAAALLAPLALYFPLRYAALEQQLVRSRELGRLLNPLFLSTPLEHFWGTWTVLGRYARLLLVPDRLNSDYGMGVFDPAALPDAYTLLGLLAAAALALALLGFRSRGDLPRGLAVCAALWWASYALISNSVLLIGVSVAERLMYWPSAPLLMMVALLTVAGWRRLERSGAALARGAAGPAVGGLLLAALGVRSAVRSLDWADNATLYAADQRTHPRSVQLCNNLAAVRIYQSAREPDAAAREALLREAERLVQSSLEVYPNYAPSVQLYGEVLALRGDTKRALEYLEAAHQVNPQDPALQRLLAVARGGGAEAREELARLEAQIASAPDDLELRRSIIELHLRTGRRRLAIPHLEHAERLAPADARIQRLKAQVLLLDRDEPGAIAALRRVLSAEPNDWEAHMNLAALLAERDPRACLEHAREASRLRPDDLRSQVNLAEALVVSGEVAEGLRRMRQIEQSLPAANPMRPMLRARIAEIERRKRW